MSDGDRVASAEMARRVANRAAVLVVETLRPDNDDSKVILETTVQAAVIRAFGCRCRSIPHEPGPVFFEDIICPLHGIGPIDLQARPEPGS